MAIFWIISFSSLGLHKNSNSPSSTPVCMSHFFLLLIYILCLRSLQTEINQPAPPGNIHNFSLLQISFFTLFIVLIFWTPKHCNRWLTFSYQSFSSIHFLNFEVLHLKFTLDLQFHLNLYFTLFPVDFFFHSQD